MRVFTFMPRFWGKVRAGEKRQTCRKRALCKPGDELSLRGWSGRPYMSPQIKLVEPVICTRVEFVAILLDLRCGLFVSVNGRVLDPFALDEFAEADGFEDAGDMAAFFAERYPRMVKRAEMFEGEVVYW